MATIASLLIDMGANVARLQQDMDRASRVISSWESRTQRTLSGVKTAFAGLGVAIGAGAFVNSIKSIVNEADELNKLSQKVGVAVDSLSSLKYAADLSDVSAEGLTKGLKALSTNMFEASTGGKEALAMFSGLNIEFESAPGKLRATDAVLLDVADRFSKMEDGAAKSAIAVKLFGREGLTLIPFLNQGRQGIAQLRQEAERLGIVMSAEMAASAEKFNDNMKAVSSSAKGLGITLANAALPKLNDIAQAMKAAAEEGGFFMAVLVGIGGAMDALFSRSDQAKLAAVQKRLQGLREEWGNIRNAPPGFRGGMDKRLDRVQAELIAALKEEEEIQARIAAQRRGTPKTDPKVQPDASGFKIDSAAEAKKKKEAEQRAFLARQQVEGALEWARVMSEANALRNL